jgi:CubicO group peptidase (beta-lactamase class C family)
LAAALALFSSTPSAWAQPATPVKSAGSQPELTKALDAILRSAVERGELVGIVLLVNKDGEPIYQGAVGWFDREIAKPMETDALFRLSSVSKVYTTMATGVLLSQGKLKLGSLLGDFLPTFSAANPKLKDKRMAKITVSHLLSHQAGFNYRFGEKIGGPYQVANISDGCESSPGLTLEENLNRIASVSLSRAPGTKYGYSVASDVLGALVARVYGQSLPQAMDALVLQPLGLTDTGFIAKNPEKLSVHYRNANPRPNRMTEPEIFKLRSGRVLTLSPQRATDPTAFPSGGCGLVGSAPSLMTVLEAIRQNGGGLVAPQVMEGFHQDAIAPSQSSPGQGFGAGWAVVVNPRAANLPVSPGTLQWGGVYGHNWYVDRTRGFSIVLMTNTALKGLTGNVKNLVLKAVYQAYPTTS